MVPQLVGGIEILSDVPQVLTLFPLTPDAAELTHCAESKFAAKSNADVTSNFMLINYFERV